VCRRRRFSRPTHEIFPSDYDVDVALRDVIKELGRRSGLEISHYRPLGRRRARQLDLQRIATVLDVGANVGKYARELRAFGYEGAILSFEPIANVFSQLERAASADPNWRCLNIAIGDTDGEATINIASNFASSSLLPMLDGHTAGAPDVYYQATEIVAVSRLDSLALDVRYPAWLKLDIQGYEDRALAGAEQTLKGVAVVEAELSPASLYGGQATFHDVMTQLHSSGFGLIDLEPSFRDSVDGRVLSVDAVFARSPR
jgi:FkbM family methyltransferase